MPGMGKEKDTFSIFKSTLYPKEKLCNHIEELSIVLVDKGKKSSRNQK